jgi:hypothetical protein
MDAAISANKAKASDFLLVSGVQAWSRREMREDLALGALEVVAPAAVPWPRLLALGGLDRPLHDLLRESIEVWRGSGGPESPNVDEGPDSGPLDGRETLADRALAKYASIFLYSEK